MISFKDFVPRQLRAPRLGLSVDAIQGEYQSLGSALAAANDWIEQSGASVINIETVLLPNLGANWETGSADPVLGQPSGGHVWHQVIRVWYEETEKSGSG